MLGFPGHLILNVGLGPLEGDNDSPTPELSLLRAAGNRQAELERIDDRDKQRRMTRYRASRAWPARFADDERNKLGGILDITRSVFCDVNGSKHPTTHNSAKSAWTDADCHWIGQVAQWQTKKKHGRDSLACLVPCAS